RSRWRAAPDVRLCGTAKSALKCSWEGAMSTTAGAQESTIVRVSFIVPILNEEGALKELVERIMSVMREIDATSYEILLVDDGSTDGSWRVVELLSKTVPNVTGYRLRRNFGKATALAVGVDMATGS